MKKLNMPDESVEYLRAYVYSLADPTSGTVSFAVVSGSTEPSSWTAGAWNGAAVLQGDGVTYKTEARILIGAGQTIAPTAGTYGAWVKVALGSESIIRRFATLEVT